MQNKEESFDSISPIRPPRGLFSRIIKRLGLEKELILVQKYLKFFVILFAIFLALSIFAFIGAKHMLAESSFGPFISLIFSDPDAVIRYWRSFLFATSESMPGIVVAGLAFSLAFLMLFIRFVVFAIDKTAILIKTINKQKYVK